MPAYSRAESNECRDIDVQIRETNEAATEEWTLLWKRSRTGIEWRLVQIGEK